MWIIFLGLLIPFNYTEARDICQNQHPLQLQAKQMLQILSIDLAESRALSVSETVLNLLLRDNLKPDEIANLGFLFRTYQDAFSSKNASLIDQNNLRKKMIDLKKPFHFSSISKPEIIDKKFDNRDHSTEATRYKIKVQSGGSQFVILFVICRETFNCLNNRDQRSPSCYVETEIK